MTQIEGAETWREIQRASTRRPITPREVPHLEALSSDLKRARALAGMSIRDLAAATRMHPTTIERIETATRRTRRSTLTRIATALVLAEKQLGPIDVLAGHFAELAGPALAAEPSDPEKAERRRRRRLARRLQAATEEQANA